MSGKAQKATTSEVITRVNQSNQKPLGWAIYTRTDPDKSWRYERTTPFREIAELAADVNLDYDTDTLVIPVFGQSMPRYLDAEVGQ